MRRGQDQITKKLLAQGYRAKIADPLRNPSRCDVQA